jgi:hypothetical protein
LWWTDSTSAKPHTPTPVSTATNTSAGTNTSTCTNTSGVFWQAILL